MLKNLISKNSDIELSFVSHFSAENEYYSPDKVIKLINESLKASGCNKKKADASQVKKLMELWDDVLQPVIDHYLSNLIDEKAFQSFHTLVEQCVYLQSAINSNSVRIARYVEETMKQGELALNNLQVDESWFVAADYFVQHIPAHYGRLRIHYLAHLKNIISAAGEDKRTKLITRLINQFKFLSSTDSQDSAKYTRSSLI